MHDLTGKTFTDEEFEYDRVMTIEETLDLPREESKDLSKRARISPLISCEGNIMVVIDRVAYVLEPCQDELH